MSTLAIPDMLTALSQRPDLTNSLTLQRVIAFIDLACLVKPQLQLHKSIYSPGPLETLPKNVHEFLKAAIGASDLEHAWATVDRES
ncbi:hypothetical protein CC2G_013897 [Coprinopsis cinerea AmutBmut pab1-1]|nr:hypothetical protein CC2G_013897 [Coprinopsis cinerea AmutBmut pab1-1]